MVVEAEGVTDGVVVTDVDGVGVGAVDDGVWVGVLVEVPVMLTVVQIVHRSRGWYERGQ